MKFFTDEYFQIGRAHLGSGKPCQDYVLAEVVEQRAFAVVSDGCSTGGRTDIGSRLICLNTMSVLKKYWMANKQSDILQSSEEMIVARDIFLAEIQNVLDLNIQDMLATCVQVSISPEGGVIVVEGDGVAAIKYCNGDIALYNFEWADNIPYYPIYTNGNLGQFIKVHGNNLEQMQVKETLYFVDKDNKINQKDEILHSLSEGINGLRLEIPTEALSNIEFIAIFSDGITQIDKVSWVDAVREMLNFKNVKGVFAKRRMTRAIQDFCKIGMGPFDDISYAVIRIDSEEVENDKEK